MNTKKNTVKTIMHLSCSLLVVLNMILTTINFYILITNSIDTVKAMMIVINSVLFFLVSVILMITGMFISEKEIIFTAKGKRNLFIIGLLAALLSGKPLHGLQGFMDLNRKKSIRRHWNAPIILVLGIILFFMDFLTAVIVTDAETLDMGYIITAFISFPCGMILTAQFIAWLLLIGAAFIWYYIDIKSRIQVPKNMNNLSQKEDKKTLVQCSSCATVFHYDHYDGICPSCGKYNPLSGNSYYFENSYKSKKAVFALLKSIGAIILVFAVIITGTVIKYKLDENNETSGMNIQLPEFHFQTEGEKNTDNIEAGEKDKGNTKIEENDKENTEIEENNKNNTEIVENQNSLEFTTDEIITLLEEIKEDDNIEIAYHKELYKNNLTDDSGEKYNEIVILIATDDSDKVYWYQFYKYLGTSKNHKEGEIVFNMGAESSTMTKSDIVNE